MQRKKLPPIRNKLDLSDRKQARLVRKRLKLSETELNRIVEKAGNSIAAIGKEAALQLGKDAARQRAKAAPEQIPVPAAVVAGAAETSSAETPTSSAQPVA